MVKEVWPMVFESTEEFGAYAREHPEVYSSLSPGGVAAELNTSRQRVHQLFQEGTLRAWVVYDAPSNIFRPRQASIILIDKGDVLYRKANPVPRGRPRKAA